MAEPQRVLLEMGVRVMSIIVISWETCAPHRLSCVIIPQVLASNYDNGRNTELVLKGMQYCHKLCLSSESQPTQWLDAF